MFGVSVRWRRAMVACGAAAVLAAAVWAVAVAAASARVVVAPPLQPGWQDVSRGPHRDLVLVHTVSRHGERTPADTFPTDPYINDTFYPYGWGSLTNVGRTHMYNLGQYMRKRYDKFLGELYTEAATYAQSTGASRARMSCALILAGMWPPAGTPLEWNPLLDWQPVPIVSQELDEDMLLLVRKRCPRYSEALGEVLNSTHYRRELAAHARLMKDLTAHSGLDVGTYDDVQSLYSTLKAEDSMGLKLADWTRDYYPEKMIPLTAESFIINAYTDEMIRLKGGVLLKKLMSEWVAAAAGDSLPRLSVFTGHDSTVANLGRALGVWEPQVPDYGITLLLELYQDTSTKQYSLEVYLQNSTRVEPFSLTIPGCSQSCPLSQVISLRGHLVPVDWESECEAYDPNYEPPPPSGP